MSFSKSDSKSSSGNIRTTTKTVTDSYNQSDYRIATDSYNKISIGGKNNSLDLSRRFDYSTHTNAGSNSFSPPIPTAAESSAIGDTLGKAMAGVDPKLLLYGIAAVAAFLLIKMFVKGKG